MNITLNLRKTLIWGIALALLGALAVAALFLSRGGNMDSAASSPEQVAVDFTRAFYAADYRNKEQWLTALKPMSTDAGYTLLVTAVAPAAWPKLTQAQTVTTAEQVQVTDNGLRAEGEDKLAGKWQIRALSISVAPAAMWPTMSASTFSANILLVQVDNSRQGEEGMWKFNAFLSDQDIALFKKGTQP